MLLRVANLELSGHMCVYMCNFEMCKITVHNMIDTIDRITQASFSNDMRRDNRIQDEYNDAPRSNITIPLHSVLSVSPSYRYTY